MKPLLSDNGTSDDDDDEGVCSRCAFASEMSAPWHQVSAHGFCLRCRVEDVKVFLDTQQNPIVFHKAPAKDKMLNKRTREMNLGYHKCAE